jgi:hypothetical protein
MKSLYKFLRNVLLSRHATDAELIRWAQTEYGNDWQTAYYQMKANPGKVPQVRGVI